MIMQEVSALFSTDEFVNLPNRIIPRERPESLIFHRMLSILSLNNLNDDFALKTTFLISFWLEAA